MMSWMRTITECICAVSMAPRSSSVSRSVDRLSRPFAEWAASRAGDTPRGGKPAHGHWSIICMGATDDRPADDTSVRSAPRGSADAAVAAAPGAAEPALAHGRAAENAAEQTEPALADAGDLARRLPRALRAPDAAGSPRWTAPHSQYRV